MTHKLAAKFTTTVATMKDRREAGATALEYAGMILVAAMVVGLIYTAFQGNTISTKVTNAINKIIP